MMRILLAEKSSFSQSGLKAFSAIARIDAFDLSPEQLLDAVGEYDGLLIRLGLRVDESVFEAGKRLCVVGTPTTGLDHIDLTAARWRNIAVLSLKGERAFLNQVYATAEHTFALLLSLVRHIPPAFDSVKGYQWRRDLYRGAELNGKALGILGCGRLGTMVARYGAAFGMKVLVYDPYQTDLPGEVERCDSLSDLLCRSDILSIHVPLNQETRGMLGDAQFSILRHGAILVNTSRGAVVNEGALLRALSSGQLGGAALDVLADELHLREKGSHPLVEYARTHENLLITPHIGGATQESVEKADLFLAGKLHEFLTTNLIDERKETHGR